MKDAFLDFRIRKNYPAFKLEVDVSFPAGVTAIFGPSGSGKTTMLNCIAGITTPDEGEINLRDRPLFSSSRKLNLPPERRRVGYMFQESLLFPHYRVRENILYGFKLTPPERRKVQPEQLVELLELGPLMERRPSNLSTGERQRVALARALATSPELLLMDEPLGSLDIALRGRILRYLKDVHSRLGIPMVYVSHSISEVLAIADRALIVSRGKQLAFDEPYKVLLQPYVHSLVETGGLENLLDVEVMEHGSGNSLTGARIGEAVLWIPGAPPGSQVGDTISIAIRAGDIIVAVERPGRISARNILKGRIQGIHRVDSEVLLYTDVGAPPSFPEKDGPLRTGPLLVEITPEALDALELYEGQEVFLVIKSSSIMVLD